MPFGCIIMRHLILQGNRVDFIQCNLGLADPTLQYEKTRRNKNSVSSDNV